MTCNRDDNDGRCNSDDGLPCVDCERRLEEEVAYWFREFRVAPLSERNPDEYRQQLREAGRGRLVDS